MASVLPASRTRTQWHSTTMGKGTYSIPRAPDDAVGSTNAVTKAHSISLYKPMDTTPPSLAVIFWSPPGPTLGHGHHYRWPPLHLRKTPRGRSSYGQTWTHTMPWEAQPNNSALHLNRPLTRWTSHRPCQWHLQISPGSRQGLCPPIYLTKSFPQYVCILYTHTKPCSC